MNPFKNYVSNRLADMAQHAHEIEKENSKQGVTVRLKSDQLRLLDTLAKELDHSRQELMVILIDAGIQAMAEAYADVFGDRAQEVYMDLMRGGNQE